LLNLALLNWEAIPIQFRFVFGRTKSAKSQVFQYFDLITTASERLKGAVGVVKFYNARKIIKSFAKTGKNVLNLKHFLMHNFCGIQFALVLGLLAHNFMNWARGEIFADTPLARMGIRKFIEQVMRVLADLKPLKIDMPPTLFPERERLCSSLGPCYLRRNHQFGCSFLFLIGG